jgi:large subunit ribosomal protein L9
MEVILRKDVPNLGHVGEVVHVKDGYGRNYLLPRGIAYAATEGNKRRIAAEQRHRKDKLAMAKTEAEQLAAGLQDVALAFTAKTGDGDRLFGSITANDIAERLEELGHRIDKRTIELEEHIKSVGEYKVPIRLHAEVRPEIQVIVARE